MNGVKSVFSIKDLENLSGIKAHTIRIWEKRYNILAPMRTETNIRVYDADALKKLLNITLLHSHGYKISKISRFPESQIPEMVNEIVSRKNAGLHAVSAFKMAMMNFDEAQFFETYDRLLAEKPLPDVFFEVVMPLMEEIGLLWQTGTITPAHEHFISYLFRLKLLNATEKAHRRDKTKTDKTYVLFLPLNEIHELGLMYINYEIVSMGLRSVYLGESVPVESLYDIKKYFKNVTYISYFTVEPMASDIDGYIGGIASEVLDTDSRLWLIGRNTANIDPESLPPRVTIFQSLRQLVREL
jgi:DNA-binding transcriptional MerR regulator